MTSLLWLSRILLLATCTAPSLGSLFNLDGNTFWNNKAPADEALAFFNELKNNDVELEGVPRSKVTNATKSDGKLPKPSVKDPAVSPVTRAASRGLDGELGKLRRGLTLSSITNSMFNGNLFDIDGRVTDEAGKKVVTAKLKSPYAGMSLPGGDLMFIAARGKSTLVLKFQTSKATFKDCEMVIVGNAYFNGVESLMIPITIEKKEEAEEFEITSFDVTGKAAKILQLLGSGAATLEDLLGIDMKSDFISKLEAEFRAFTGFGAFNKDGLQVVIHLDDTSAITQAAQAKSIDLLISQNGARTPRKLSAFITIEDFIQKLGALFNQADLFENNFLLKHLGGEVCLFLVSSDVEYMDAIKSDERMSVCFGNQEEEKAKDAFKSTQAGLHAHIKVDFKDALLKGCWNERDDTPAELNDMDMEVEIYAKISKSGVACSLLSNVTIPTKLITACFGGLMRQAPEYLTSGQITLNHLSKDKVEEEGKPTKNHWKINLIVAPAEEYSTLPGTSISLKNFELDAEGDQGDNDSWEIDAKLSVELGRESNIDLSLKKEGSEFFVEASSNKITLSDLLFAFTAPRVGDDDSQGVLDTLGVKDFSFSMKMGKNLPKHEYLVNGKPILFGFDKLEIAAVLVKENAPVSSSSGSVKSRTTGGSGSGSGGSGGGGRGGASIKYAVGLYLNGADFTAMVKNIFNKDINLQWLTGLKAIAVFTNDAGNVVLKTKDAEDAEEEDSSGDDEKKSKKKVKGRLTKKHSKKAKKVEKKTALVSKNDTKLLKPSLPQALQRRGLARATREDAEAEAESKSELKFDELHEELNDKAIDSPIMFAVIWTIPVEDDIGECHDNPLCVWMVKNIKPSEGSDQPVVSIIGELGDGQFKLSASIDIEVKFIDKPTEKLTFKGLKLELEVGTSMPKIQLSCSMTYENEVIGAVGDNALKFTGAIMATPISMSLTFTMEGFIFPKFGDVSYIGIGDITLGGGYSGGVPSFTFGAAIKLGLFETTGASPPDTSKAIVIRGHFGVNIGQPAENWIYGSINHLTVGHVCDAFQLTCDNVPTALKGTGFPYGIIASYTGTPREVPGVGQIEPGLQIKGTINIFGFECACEFGMEKVGSSYKVNFVIEMSPIDWANGMIKVSRSDSDSENGPIASANFSSGAASEFAFCIEGYGNLLFDILSLKVKIQIDSTKFLLEVEGYLIPAFLFAKVKIEANYGGSADSDNPLFTIVASVSLSFKEKLKEAIDNFFNYLQEKVDEMKAVATEALRNATEKVEGAQRTVNGWKQKIETWKTTLEKRKKKLEDDMKPPPCDCPQVCFPFLDWDSRCWKVWGYWVGCPYWNSCFKMIPDIFCLAGCGIRKVVNTLVKWAKQAILSIGQLIASGVQGLLTLADGVLELAKSVLRAAQRVVNLFTSLLSKAVNLAKEKLRELLDQFALHELTLSATLNADFTACVGYFYNLTFFGKEQTGKGEACLDLTSFTSKLVGGVSDGDARSKDSSKTTERLKEIESEGGEVKKADSEFDKEDANAAKKVDQESSQTLNAPPSSRDDIPTFQAVARSLEKVPRHHTVPSKKEMEMIELANRKIPRYSIQGDERVRSFVDESPWQLPTNHMPIGHSETVRHDETETVQKRSLDFDTNLTPCNRMKRVLQGYSDLTDGILKYSEAVQKSKSEMQKSRISDTEKLHKFQNFVHESESKHNMTAQDREDVYFVYNNVANRHEELVQKSTIAMHTEDQNAMPIIRRHINNLLGKEKGTNFVKFTDVMHSNAVEGYKRSRIPHPADVEGEKILGDIKQDLQAIVTDESSPLTPMTPRLQIVKKNIIAMTGYVKQCHDN